MKPYPLVEIIWQDAHGGDEGWTKLDRSHSQLREIRSVGMIARESEFSLTLVQSIDKATHQIGGYICIPKSNITSRKELR